MDAGYASDAVYAEFSTAINSPINLSFAAWRSLFSAISGGIGSSMRRSTYDRTIVCEIMLGKNVDSSKA